MRHEECSKISHDKNASPLTNDAIISNGIEKGIHTKIIVCASSSSSIILSSFPSSVMMIIGSIFTAASIKAWRSKRRRGWWWCSCNKWWSISSSSSTRCITGCCCWRRRSWRRRRRRGAAAAADTTTCHGSSLNHVSRSHHGVWVKEWSNTLSFRSCLLMPPLISSPSLSTKGSTRVVVLVFWHSHSIIRPLVCPQVGLCLTQVGGEWFQHDWLEASSGKVFKNILEKIHSSAWMRHSWSCF